MSDESIAGAVIPALAESSMPALWSALHDMQPVAFTTAAFALFTYVSWSLDRPRLVGFVRKAIA